MSEENVKTPAEESGEGGISAAEPELIQLIVNKSTGDIVFKSPDGKSVTAKAQFIEESEAERDLTGVPPLTPEQFGEALQRLHGIGLTWTADHTIKPIIKEGDDALMSADFEQFRKEYPTLPREVNSIAFHHLTGTTCPEHIAGDEETLRRKIEIAKEFYINDEYRSEFFFKYAIKVPYFSEIDWEVVVKTFEKNVRAFTGVAYALLTLHLDSPDKSKAKKQTITVAANLKLVDTLLATLEEVKKALEGTQAIAGVLYNAREIADKAGKAENTEDAHPNDTAKVG